MHNCAQLLLVLSGTLFVPIKYMADINPPAHYLPSQPTLWINYKDKKTFLYIDEQWLPISMPLEHLITVNNIREITGEICY